MDFVHNLEKIVKFVLQGERVREYCGNSTNANSYGDTNCGEITSTDLERILTSVDLLLKIIQNNYDASLNLFIENIFNQIQYLLEFSIDKKILPVFPLHHFFNIITSTVEIMLTHPYEGTVNNITKFYTCNMNRIKFLYDGKHGDCSPSSEECSIRLRIISIIYEAVHNVKMRDSKYAGNEAVNLVTAMKSDECKLFPQLLTSDSKVVAAQTLLNVIPRFIDFSENSSILEYVWAELSLNNDIEYEQKFIILCYMCDLYFRVDNKKIMVSLFNDPNFWLLLQTGLMDFDSATRKQALFILKTSINYIIENDINFSCCRHQSEAIGTSKSIDLLICRDSNSNKLEDLSELCVIMEFLEEKQFHILKPVFNRIERFIERNIQTSKLPITWVVPVLKMMLNHDNIKIVRCGISNILKVPVAAFRNEGEMSLIINLLVSSLNCTQLYMNDWSAMLNELKIYFETCSNSENSRSFFKLLLREICSVQWSSEALFFMINSLQLVKSKKYWGKDELNLIKKLLIGGSVNHYTYIKSGVHYQLLSCAINLIDTDAVPLEDVVGFLNCFQRETCLQRKNELWSKVTDWIGQSYQQDVIEDVITRSVSGVGDLKDIGKMIVIAWDVTSQFSVKVKQALEGVAASFMHVHARPYCDMEKQYGYLSTISEVLRESSGDMDVVKVFTPFIADIVSFIQMQLSGINHIRDFDLCQRLIQSLDVFLRFDKDNVSASVIYNWIQKIGNDIELTTNPMQSFIQAKVLGLVISHEKEAWYSVVARLRPYLRSVVNCPVSRTSEELGLSRDLQILWGRMNSECLRARWMLLSSVCASLKDLHITEEEFLQVCFEGLDVAGHAVLLPMMNLLRSVVPTLSRVPEIGRLFETIWNGIAERKKNEDFYELVHGFVRMVFHPKMVEAGDAEYQTLLFDYSRRLLSENAIRAANIFMKYVQELGTSNRTLLVDILSRALLFGQVQRKDERLIGEVSAIIESCGLSALTNDWCTHSQVRARAVAVIITKPLDLDFVVGLIEAIITLEEDASGNKLRYFSDSYVHRVKQRSIQSVLMLHALLRGFAPCGKVEETRRKLWNWVSSKMLTENDQPSVRYLHQWLMFRLITESDAFLDEMLKFFDEVLEKRTGSLCSLISVAYLIVRFADSLKFDILRVLIPCCMAQHFSIRLYAQVALQKILENGHCDIGNYDLVLKSLNQSIERGNLVKNCAKLQEDFFFSVFDPERHFSVETILYDLPRLANVSSDEWIEVRLLQQCTSERGRLNMRSEDGSLRSFEGCVKWSMEGAKQDNFMEDVEDGKENWEMANQQKKMIPVKRLLPSLEDLDQSISYSSRKDDDKDGLIVVASLIDRMPNLGGLSRTCEVFGASELVIGSLKYTEDKQFQSLSVTAEKWIRITEVKPYHLSEYLTSMKRMGYTILAAEQTTNSRPLQAVQFPRKSILLLGNEKEGIPPSLLPLMDICVEIPQAGVIRSLNVHVTGALFIWEYAKQHNITR